MGRALPRPAAAHQEDIRTTKLPHSTETPTEHALLIAVDWWEPTPRAANGNGASAALEGVKPWETADSLEELARLAETAGIEVVGAVSQKLSRPHPATYVGKGKLAEIKELKDDLGYDLVIVDLTRQCRYSPVIRAPGPANR